LTPSLRCFVMTCWKWFGTLAKEAGIEINDANKEKIDKFIHEYIGKQSSYGRCSADWKKARKEIVADEKMKKELLSQLKAIA
jgi:single-stranded DNA-specific DHH superfamily exonuclease